MRPNMIDKDSLSDNILRAISQKTGIDNFSGSSKIRTVVESFSEELSIFSNSIDAITNNIFTETADGPFLDANGAEYGIYRKSVPNLNIKASDGIGYIRPINEDVGFNSMLIGKVIINSGLSIDVGNKYRITFTDDVIIQAGQREVPASIRIALINKDSNISIGQNSEFRLDSTMSPLLTNIKLVFDRAIEVKSIKEKDSQLRERIILAKNTIRSASESAIQLALMNSPFVFGYRLDNIGAGIVDIKIATKELLDYGYEPNAQIYIDVIKNSLNEFGAGGIIYNVDIPKQLNFLANIKFKSDTVDEETAKNIVLSVMKNNYKYSNNSTIFINSINKIIENITGQENAVIVESMGVYDPDVDIIITNSEYSISIPAYGFLFFNKEGIEVESI